MKLAIATSSACLLGFASAHGIVQNLKIGSDWWTGSLVYQDPYQNPVPSRIVWPFFSNGNGPVKDVTSNDITCNVLSGTGALTAEVAAGSQVTFYWDTWPESHKGPAMTYLAYCGTSPCSSVSNPSSLSYFKIAEDGWDGSAWLSDRLIANNYTVSATIPSDIKPGYYLMRHELLALHESYMSGGAQFYPSCTNLKITGSGTAEPGGVSFPGAYSASDPGIYVNIYSNFNPSNYVIPGPAVYVAGSGSGSGSSSSSAASSSPASSSSPATSAAPATSAVATTCPSCPTVTSCPSVDYEDDVQTFILSQNGIEITGTITVTAKVTTVTVTA